MCVCVICIQCTTKLISSFLNVGRRLVLIYYYIFFHESGGHLNFVNHAMTNTNEWP